MYHLPCICCTLVTEIPVHPEMLSVFRYIDILDVDVIVMTPEQQGPELLVCLEDGR